MVSPMEREEFPWDDIVAALEDRSLQRRYRQRNAKAALATDAVNCPNCDAPPADQTWLFFESPPWTWEHLCGRAGWMTICMPCQRQVNFFLEILN